MMFKDTRSVPATFSLKRILTTLLFS